jgi:hypothetical protein
MIETYEALRWKEARPKNKLAEEGSEMSFCLGAKGLVGGRIKDGPQSPGRMRSAKEENHGPT